MKEKWKQNQWNKVLILCKGRKHGQNLNKNKKKGVKSETKKLRMKRIHDDTYQWNSENPWERN